LIYPQGQIKPPVAFLEALHLATPDEKQSTIVTEGAARLELHSLRLAELGQIDEHLGEIGGYGELRLVVEKGWIRFVEVVKSRGVSSR